MKFSSHYSSPEIKLSNIFDYTFQTDLKIPKFSKIIFRVNSYCIRILKEVNFNHEKA